MQGPARGPGLRAGAAIRRAHSLLPRSSRRRWARRRRSFLSGFLRAGVRGTIGRARQPGAGPSHLVLPSRSPDLSGRSLRQSERSGGASRRAAFDRAHGSTGRRARAKSGRFGRLPASHRRFFWIPTTRLEPIGGAWRSKTGDEGSAGLGQETLPGRERRVPGRANGASTTAVGGAGERVGRRAWRRADRGVGPRPQRFVNFPVRSPRRRSTEGDGRCLPFGACSLSCSSGSAVSRRMVSQLGGP